MAENKDPSANVFRLPLGGRSGSSFALPGGPSSGGGVPGVGAGQNVTGWHPLYLHPPPPHGTQVPLRIPWKGCAEPPDVPLDDWEEGKLQEVDYPLHSPPQLAGTTREKGVDPVVSLL